MKRLSWLGLHGFGLRWLLLPLLALALLAPRQECAQQVTFQYHAPAGAVAPDGVIDVFAAAGLKKPDLSILSPKFLEDVRNMPQKNLAVELLDKLLRDEVRARGRHNAVQSRAFSEKLEAAIGRYQNRSIETAQVIEELLELARQMREAQARGEALNLTEDEIAFYDALEVNDSAVKILGDEADEEEIPMQVCGSAARGGKRSSARRTRP